MAIAHVCSQLQATCPVSYAPIDEVVRMRGLHVAVLLPVVLMFTDDHSSNGNQGDHEMVFSYKSIFSYMYTNRHCMHLQLEAQDLYAECIVSQQGNNITLYNLTTYGTFHFSCHWHRYCLSCSVTMV
jgi:hypothetical protein